MTEQTANIAQAALIADIAGFARDPLSFVLYVFPWGVAGTPLAAGDGPDQWQRDLLSEIGAALAAEASTSQAVQMAIASGHGIGKSALVAWLLLWAMATHEETRGVVTANT